MADKINPKWAKPSMSLSKAGHQAYHRGAVLRVSWSPSMGLRVVAVQVRECKERGT